MNEQYFFVRKLGLGKEVVSLSLVVTEVSRSGGMRRWSQTFFDTRARTSTIFVMDRHSRYCLCGWISTRFSGLIDNFRHKEGIYK